MLKKSILVIIPARAGSQRVKNKNLRSVNKRPLVIWSINYAKKIEKIFQNTKIIVSTDSLKIKKISESSETNVIQRPKNISGNKASMHSVISHILGKIDKKNKFDFIILLQPTSPIRKISWIKKSFKILNENKKYENLIHLNRLNISANFKKIYGNQSSHQIPDHKILSINLNLPVVYLFIKEKILKI